MRSTQTCPKCSRRKFLVSNEFRQPDWRYVNGTHPVIPVTLDYEPAKKFLESGNRPALGRFETWICLACGYTELYVHGLPHDIEEIARAHPDRLRVVDAEPSNQGPYR